MIDHIVDGKIQSSYRSWPAELDIDGTIYRVRDLARAGHIADVNALGLFERTRQEANPDLGEDLDGYELQIIDGRPVEVPQIRTLTAAEYAQRLKDQADKQFRLRRQGGITVGGARVDTSADAKAEILDADASPLPAGSRRVIGGHVTELTNQNIGGMLAAIRSYTIALGNHHADMYDAIDAAAASEDPLEALRQIDTSAGWPSDEY